MSDPDHKTNQKRRVSSQQTKKVLRWQDDHDEDEDDVIDESRQHPRRRSSDVSRSSKNNNQHTEKTRAKSNKNNQATLLVVPLTAKRRKSQRSQPQFPSNSVKSSLTSASKPVRHDASSHHHLQQQNQQEQSMWVDKYAPMDSKSLCVAPKKVKEIKSWLEHAVTTMQDATTVMDNNPGRGNKLLILVGSPGIGKSTMIRVLANELKLQIHEWTDVVSTSSSRTYDYGDASLESLPLLQSLHEFLQKAGAGFQSLQMTTTTTTRAAITTTASSSSSAAMPSISGNRPASNRDKNGKKRKLPGSLSQADHETKNRNNYGSVILLDELPNLPNAEMEARFREIMTEHLVTTQVPTVLIFSHVREGRHKPDDLERLVEPHVLYSSALVQITQIHSVTKPKLKSILEHIARQERLLSTSQLKNMKWEEVHLQCQGDVRHAIMSLQFEHAADETYRDYKGSNTNTAQHRSERDVKLSTFHALGKLLYAKKRVLTISNGADTERQVLDFDPDAVMEHADMGLSGSLTFLEYHSPEFFTDVTELSETLALYSDAVTLLDSTFQSDRTIFPNAYVGAVAGRAVAYSNHHPAPSKFRQFCSPKVFEVLKRRKQNLNSMDRLCQQLSQQNLLSVNEVITSGSTFVKDHIPYLRFIIPEEVNSTLSALHSSQANTATTRGMSAPHMDHTEQLQLEQYAEEQQDMLDFDDILDSDDDDNGKLNGILVEPKKTLSISAGAILSEIQAVELLKDDASVSPTSAVDDMGLGLDIIIIDD